MQFFDSHCHFDFDVFDKNRALIWRECNALGVTHLIIPGIAPQQWPLAASISQYYENIHFGVGVHPWWIEKNITDNNINHYLDIICSHLQKNITQQKCVAIGECGLDAAIETSLVLQQHVFDVHLQLAQQTSMPLIIHCRKAHNELLIQLKRYNLPAGGVIHGFTGSYELAASYWAMGFRLGIGGSITYERANKTRMAVKKLPLDALLLETDAPDMPLKGKQGEPNSPINIVQVAQTLAELRNESLAKIVAHTTFNSHALFKIGY